MQLDTDGRPWRMRAASLRSDLSLLRFACSLVLEGVQMPDFPALPFDRMNEADVREEVISPLIRSLGYRTGTENNVVREQGLRYPRQYLGRKDPARDPGLRGKADYILEVKGRVRWVIEAKAPGVELGPNDSEQAWSYANHPEVRAVYYALCNGWQLSIYSTSHGPNSGALLKIDYSALAENWARVLGRC